MPSQTNNTSNSKTKTDVREINGVSYRIEPGADLRNADLRNANLRHADLRGADLRNANLRDADLRNANLRDADLRGADLRGVNLRGANLDYASWPLWCGSVGRVLVDDRIARQLLYHALSVAPTSVPGITQELLDYVNEFYHIHKSKLPKLEKKS